MLNYQFTKANLLFSVLKYYTEFKLSNQPTVVFLSFYVFLSDSNEGLNKFTEVLHHCDADFLLFSCSH